MKRSTLLALALFSAASLSSPAAASASWGANVYVNRDSFTSNCIEYDGTGQTAAKKAAADSGLESTAPDEIIGDPTTNGWQMTWHRTVGGVPVRGDGTVVSIWPDGQVASITHTAHDLAAMPAVRLSAQEALVQANQSLDKMAATGKRSDFSAQPPVLQWVLPNGILGGAKPVTGESIARLAWVVNVQISGSTRDNVTGMMLFIDAGDGTLLGGDSII